MPLLLNSCHCHVLLGWYILWDIMKWASSLQWFTMILVSNAIAQPHSSTHSQYQMDELLLVVTDSLIGSLIGCNNDWGVQAFEEELFNGQPCLTWRGRSHNAGVLLFDEYLQFCYFMLYLCVAGIPFGFWLMGYFATRYNNTPTPSSGGAGLDDGSSLSATSPTSLPSESPSASEVSDAASVSAASSPGIDGSGNSGPNGSVILATPRGPAMFTPMIPVGNGWVAKQRAKLLRDPWYDMQYAYHVHYRVSHGTLYRRVCDVCMYWYGEGMDLISVW
jgi:hypothetical protein